MYIGFSSPGRAVESLTLNKYTPLEEASAVSREYHKDFFEAHPTVHMEVLSSDIREQLFSKLIEKNFCDISKYSSEKFSGEKGSVKVLQNQRLLRALEVSIPYTYDVDCLPIC